MRYTTYSLLTLGISAVDISYDDTLFSCVDFSNEFDNTCDNTQVTLDYENVPTT